MCLIPFFIIIDILIISTISIHVFFSSISSQKGDYNRTQIVPERKKGKIEKNTKDAGKKMMSMLLIGGCRVALGTTKNTQKRPKNKERR